MWILWIWLFVWNKSLFFTTYIDIEYIYWEYRGSICKWTGKCIVNIAWKQQAVRLFLLLSVTGMLGRNTHAVQEILSPSEGSEQVRTSESDFIICKRHKCSRKCKRSKRYSSFHCYICHCSMLFVIFTSVSRLDFSLLQTQTCFSQVKSIIKFLCCIDKCNSYLSIITHHTGKMFQVNL